MRQYLTRLLLSTLVLGVIASVSTTTLAQRRGLRGRLYTKDEVNELIKRAEDRSDRFIRLFDKALDKSSLDGSRREDRLNERAKDLEKAMDALRREFDRKESYIATKPEMIRVLNTATGINQVMLNRRMGGEAEASWNALRTELNILASVYYLPRLRG
jgi:hypothetical protein